jgi:sulfatase modifying factor 1
MDDQNKAIKIVRFICEYAMEKSVSDVIESLPSGKFTYMVYELSKGIYDILSTANEEDREAILRDVSGLTDSQIQEVAQSLSSTLETQALNPAHIDQNINQAVIQETLHGMRRLNEEIGGLKKISPQMLRHNIQLCLLKGRSEVKLSHFSEQQTMLGSQVTHVLTLRGSKLHHKSHLLGQDMPIPQISGFEIQGVLGKGSFAIVYLAIDQAHDRVCALKVGLLDQEERFNREVKNMKAIDHPHVLSCWDAGIVADLGKIYYWISMPNMMGVTVEDLLTENLEEESKWVILTEILSGLSALHEKGIVHRDLKPSNCLIADDFKIKLTDFGLSKKIANGNHDQSLSESKVKTAIGTPAYMSPEQFKGKDISFESDIWAFAMIMYQILSGAFPFAQAENEFDLGAMVIKDEIDFNIIEELKYPISVVQLLKKCLDKNSDRRYQNAMLLFTDFQAIANLQIQKIRNRNTQTTETQTTETQTTETQTTETQTTETQTTISPENQTEISRRSFNRSMLSIVASFSGWFILNRYQNHLENLKMKALENQFGPKFRLLACQGTAFEMGLNLDKNNPIWSNAQPSYSVDLSDVHFWMGESLVTQELWIAVMGWNPSYFKGDLLLPVEHVNWYDAISFCNTLSQKEGLSPCYELSEIQKKDHHIISAKVRLLDGENGYRLPSETEWEFVAKAGKSQLSEIEIRDDLALQAWYYANADQKTHPIKSKKANAWGFYDMVGHIWEWCQDEYDVDIYQKRKNGDQTNLLNWQEKGQIKVAKGGSVWQYLSDCHPCIRKGFGVNSKVDLKGIRLVRDQL